MNFKNIGLVFAGGGGKGSYQTGVLKGLEFLGLSPYIRCAAGSSVGALSTVLTGNANVQDAERIWKSIRPVSFMDFSNAALAAEEGSLLERLLKNAAVNGICSRDGLNDILDTDIDLALVSQSSISMFVCTTLCHCADDLFTDGSPLSTQAVQRNAVYTKINGLASDVIKNLLLASTAMPYVYPPVNIDGLIYRDGGMSDNVPVKALVGMDIDTLLVVKLEPDDKVDTTLYPQFQKVIEIVPSREIGDLTDGTLDFSQKNVDFRIQLGFYDTLRIMQFEEMKDLGFPPTSNEISTREAQDFQKVLSAVKRNKLVTKASKNLDALNALVNKYSDT